VQPFANQKGGYKLYNGLLTTENAYQCFTMDNSCYFCIGFNETHFESNTLTSTLSVYDCVSMDDDTTQVMGIFQALGIACGTTGYVAYPCESFETFVQPVQINMDISETIQYFVATYGMIPDESMILILS
jgi:hypothetical protein